ncbi:nucleoside-diphosphate-sugar epimerase [Neomicrococcus aestuarii]|uniref:Nucleoside-diphosphate-sugar epimerase n=1 Tax=Neomicrococcus aestuarii TaxID=556325 RepID=A0A7W8TU90_9MICC|nr:NAD-dependent epimerase/dehydratase family protein [Neomicrococcus aestuarii]MBB5512128.1 nucleoside-diphosphate-sugar epimerase [Neomicrococcus aestuarii]
MKILVTGASGMLGAAVAHLLMGRGHEVTSFQRGLTKSTSAQVPTKRGSVGDAAAVSAAIAGHDAVVHLAAKVSFTGEWDEFVQTNIEGTRNVIAACREHGVRDLVFVSSPSVAHLGTSIAGVGADPADPVHARGFYARSKAQAEIEALAADGGELRVCALRPHIVWGPGDTQLVERVMDRAAAGRLPLLDGGRALIDTTYVDNAAEAVVRGLERMDVVHGRALVITNGEPRPVSEMIAGICAAAGIEPPRTDLPGRLARLAGRGVEKAWLAGLKRGWVQDEPPMTEFLAEQLSTSHWFDQRETQRLLEWTPSVSIDEGFERLAAHYRR